MKKNFLLSIFFLLQACTGLFFHPTKEIVQTPSELGIAYQDILLTTPDNIRLHAWYIPAVLPQGSPAKGTVLFLHGNAENISTHTFNVLWLVLKGYNLFALDYRGYGQSEGTPSFDGIETDINTALKYLTEKEPGKIFVFGQSLGGAVAVAALGDSPYKNKISGVIVDSAFSKTRRIAREKVAEIWFLWPLQYPLSFLVSENNPEEHVKKLHMNKFFITTLNDAVVPSEHTKILFKKAPSPKELWIVPEGGHIQALHDENIRQHLLNFLDRQNPE